MPMLYSVEPTYPSVSVGLKLLCTGLNQHLSVFESSVLYINPFIFPLKTFTDKGIMKSESCFAVVSCQAGHEVAIIPA